MYPVRSVNVASTHAIFFRCRRRSNRTPIVVVVIVRRRQSIGLLCMCTVIPPLAHSEACIRYETLRCDRRNNNTFGQRSMVRTQCDTKVQRKRCATVRTVCPAAKLRMKAASVACAASRSCKRACVISETTLNRLLKSTHSECDPRGCLACRKTRHKCGKVTSWGVPHVNGAIVGTYDMYYVMCIRVKTKKNNLRQLRRHE